MGFGLFWADISQLGNWLSYRNGTIVVEIGFHTNLDTAGHLLFFVFRFDSSMEERFPYHDQQTKSHHYPYQK